jgi:hypothetical protein
MPQSGQSQWWDRWQHLKTQQAECHETNEGELSRIFVIATIKKPRGGPSWVPHWRQYERIPGPELGAWPTAVQGFGVLLIPALQGRQQVTLQSKED